MLGDVVAGAVGAPDGDRQGLPLTIGIEAGDGETDIERIPERDDGLRDESGRSTGSGGSKDILDARDERMTMDTLVIAVKIAGVGHVRVLRRQHRGDTSQRRVSVGHILTVMQAVIGEIRPATDRRETR